MSEHPGVGSAPDVPPLDPDVVVWSAPPDDRADRPLVVLLHGYGSDERDLAGLVPYLPDAFVYASVRAPLTPPFPAPGHSWYPIEGLQTRDPGWVTASAARLHEWIDASGHRGLVGLLGFSQGAAVALQTVRLHPDRYAFAVNLSGYVTPGALPRDGELADVRPPVFWGRGSHDDVIPAHLVAHTTEWLPEHVTLSGRVYAGLSHSVSEAELTDVRVFLELRLEAAAEAENPADDPPQGPPSTPR
jgi:phospholipase/carboxylesterase